MFPVGQEIADRDCDDVRHLKRLNELRRTRQSTESDLRHPLGQGVEQRVIEAAWLPFMLPVDDQSLGKHACFEQFEQLFAHRFARAGSIVKPPNCTVFDGERKRADHRLVAQLLPGLDHFARVVADQCIDHDAVGGGGHYGHGIRGAAYSPGIDQRRR